MQVYVGQTRSAEWVRRCERRGFGEMTVRGQLPSRRTPWAYDNGAYGDWRAGKPFDFNRYTRDLRRIRNEKLAPDFIVLPDVPTKGRESLAQSIEWMEWTRAVLAPVEIPLYLAVQDELTPRDLRKLAIDGVFVGGTLGWKMSWGRTWCNWAHTNGISCHIGRVGTAKRVTWARTIEADSIDSCQPLRNEIEFARFCRALDAPLQGELF